MTIPLPTYEQVLELPAVIERSVPEEFIDLNGHMNIGRYLEVAALALDESTVPAGLYAGYIERRGLSTFTAEHHLRYVSELRLGDRLSAHVRLLDRSDRVIHALAFILDRDRRLLSATCETILVHVDMAARRPVPFPDDVSAGLDAVIAEHALSWPAPVCGSMGVRRRA